MGIELKGWHVLAKEREPSFRYKVTPAACSPWTGNRNITPPEAITHYPIKRDMISDRPERDMGGNFGRFARTNAMNNYIKLLFDESLAGIPLWAWQRFLALFTENRTADDVQCGLDTLAKMIAPATMTAETMDCLLQKFREIGEIIADDT